MKKIFSKKLMFVIAILSVLAMMIPMSIPVSAAGPALTTVDSSGQQTADGGYNVIGTQVTVSNGGVPSVVNGSIATLVSETTYVNSTVSENNFTNVDGSVNKKWGTIDHTTFSPFSPAGNSSYVTWNEAAKEWLSPEISITDTVTGMFHSGVNSNVVYHAAQGAILHWYLVDANQTVPMAAGEANPDLMDTMDDLIDARFTTFTANGTHYIRTVTGIDGSSTVSFQATGEESIKIVVVQEYPGDPQEKTTPEVTSYNFKTREMEVVPQVRWAGEKIVLEAYYGDLVDLDNFTVKFSLSNESNGILTAIDGLQLSNQNNSNDSVWTTAASSGLFSVVLESQNQGQIDVNAALYYINPQGGLTALENQQDFTVYYLKFESLVLSDVIGKRALYKDSVLVSHKDGQWTEANPWDETLDYETVVGDDNDTLNVSQDALLRARVKGWFTNGNPTTREAGSVSIGTTYDLALPAGRYVLPDDWAMLAGPQIGTRIHWDIMDDPTDAIMSVHNSTVGPYKDADGNGAVVAAADVVGPFSPGMEIMLDTGWATSVENVHDMARDDYKTVVPNGEIDSWDAPMPPAKIVFQINSGVGYFKDAMKDTIYYLGDVTTNGPYHYTAPFYWANIPAHEAIPPTVANGGYDWDAFGFNAGHDAYGAYPFWKIINEPDGPVTPEAAGLPTKVEVYSDNHGEAMVYLNGDANLKLKANNGGVDLPFGYEVGKTTVQAWADYPYYRKHQAIYSNEVYKTWLWGGQILGVDANQTYAPMVLVAGSDNVEADDYITLTAGTSYLDPAAMGTSNKHVVWVWVTDRDGMQAGVLDAQVDWVISGIDARFYNGGAFTGINPNAPYSTQLSFTGWGFLDNADHQGVRDAGANIKTGTSWLRAPTPAEAGIFYKFYNPSKDPDGLQPTNFAVSAIDIVADGEGTVKVAETITSKEYAASPYAVGTIMRATNFTTTVDYPLDDQIVLGDANLDGKVNMMDITAVERIILGMAQSRVVQADANHNTIIDMGDVIRIEKIYLGL